MTGSAKSGGSRKGKAGKFRKLTSPEGWKRNIVKGRGLDIATIEARAHEAIERLRDEYVACARRELAQVNEALAKARSGPKAARDTQLRLVRRIAHDMRGQAETFGYPLITTIGSSLCGYIEETDTSDSIQLKVIEIHANAMHAVITGDIKGNGGKTGRQLLTGMRQMVSKTLG